MINPIAVAIPLFLVAIVAEVAVAARRGRLGDRAKAAGDVRPVYRTPDALADLGCGIVSQATGLYFAAVLTAGVYVGTFAWIAPFTLPTNSVFTWLFAFVAVDFLYYWWHRASHRVNVLWAAHVVHHQSEDYNLAVALRQAVFTPLTSIAFYLPLVLVGVSPLVFLTCAALNTLYQFWIHTRLIRQMPAWIELIFNTPSHHRVHHGINPHYIDRNHAGVFIVWDRLFGTFQPEVEEPVYGVVEGFPTYDVFAANLRPYAKLFGNAAQAGLADGVRLLFGPPEWRPASLGGPVHIPEPGLALRYDPPVSPGVQRYTVAWFAPMAAVIFGMLWFANSADLRLLWLGAAFIFATQFAQGRLLDGGPSARKIELARLVFVLPMLLAAAVWVMWDG
jgi:alkylglycerol monooxygenase